MTVIVDLFTCSVLASCLGFVDASGGSAVPLVRSGNASVLAQAPSQPNITSSSGGQPAPHSSSPPAMAQPAQPSKTGPAANSQTPAAAAQTRSKSADKLKYDAHMATARAFVEADENAKAIESYEKAILVAPNENARNEAAHELKSIVDWSDDEWFAPALGVIQSMWFWVGVVLLLYVLVALYLLVRRFIRWCCVRLGGKRRYRVILGPRSESELTPYFRDLIQRADDLLEEQMTLARKIGTWSTMTIASGFESESLLIDLPFRLPKSVAGNWWWVPFVEAIVRRLDGPDYSVNVSVLRTENDFGLSVRLCDRSRLMQHWHESCPGNTLGDNVARLAHKVVSNIKEHLRKGHHVP